MEAGLMVGDAAEVCLSGEALFAQLADFPVVMLDALPTSRHPLKPHGLLAINARQLSSYGGSLETAVTDLEHYRNTGSAVLVLCGGEVRARNLLRLLEERGEPQVRNGAKLADLLRRPRITYEELAPFDPERPALDAAVREQVEIQLKYAGYITRQLRDVAEFEKEEARALPPGIDYASIGGLRLEARQKLARIRPQNLGQASRISGVSPADIAVLLIWLEQNKE